MYILGNYSSLSNQKDADLCLKCTKIRLEGRVGRGGKGPTYKEREEGKGPASKRDGRERKEERGDGKGGGGNSPCPRSQGEYRINTASWLSVGDHTS